MRASLVVPLLSAWLATAVSEVLFLVASRSVHLPLPLQRHVRRWHHKPLRRQSITRVHEPLRENINVNSSQLLFLSRRIAFISGGSRIDDNNDDNRNNHNNMLHMGKRTELGASPRKTDSRSVTQWLGLTPREVDVLRRPLGRSAGRDLEKRLGLVADGQTDSVVGFFRVDFRMSKADARSVISRYPQLLFMPRQEAVDRCNWLIDNLSLNKKQLTKMVLKFPRLLSYGVTSSYAPVVKWCGSYLGMTPREVARLVQRLPQLLSLTPDGNVENTVRFLESLGLNREQVRKMVLLHPEIFSYSIEEKVIPMLEWLQMELRASPDEVIQMVARYPSLLGCSPQKNLAPKFSFFREVLKASVADIRAAVVATPSLLGYSLDSRICPRATILLERGIDPDFAEHRWLLTATSQKKFEQWVKENSGAGR